MTDKIRWGILGTGYIARQFAAALRTRDDAEITAVGSRAQDTADAFGNQYQIPRRYPSYEALVQDPDVDVIYIASPHTLHCENTLLCLNAGKHVLCEKPLAVNARQAEVMIRLARQKKLFLMEAVWTRFFPVMNRLREMLLQEVIGIPRVLTADFGFAAKHESESRLFSPEFAGGALLDIGIYPVMLASMIFGEPLHVAGVAQIGPTGVDEQDAIAFSYQNGAVALLHATFQTITPNEAVLTGTLGRIKIHTPWWKPAQMTLTLFSKGEELMSLPYAHEGYQYEAAEVMHCLRVGQLESEIMPLRESLSLQRTMDQLRSLWNLRYPIDDLV